MRGKGEGSIFKRPDGRWEAQLDLGYAGGKRNRRSFYGRTRTEVKDKLKEAQGLVADGLTIPPERYTVGQLVADWLHDSSDTRSARTTERYLTVARLHVLPHLGHVKLRDLGPQHIERFQQELRKAGLAPRTIIKARSVLSGALKRAERWRLIPRNPVSLVKLPRTAPSEQRTLSRQEALAFVEAVRGDRLEALYLVVIALGVRRGEALGLAWRDVDWQTGAISINQQLQRVEHGGGRQLLETKTRAGRRRLYLPPIALVKIAEHQERQQVEREQAGEIWQDHGLVFCSLYGTPIEPRNLNRSFAALRDRLGIPELKLHGLRHSATSLYLALGVPPHVVQAIMGHTDPAVTLGIYAHALDEDRRSAATLMGSALFGDWPSIGSQIENPAVG